MFSAKQAFQVRITIIVVIVIVWVAVKELELSCHSFQTILLTTYSHYASLN